MIHSTIAAGVYDDADHNTTERSLIDLLEPAGELRGGYFCVAPNVLSRYFMESLYGGVLSTRKRFLQRRKLQ